MVWHQLNQVFSILSPQTISWEKPLNLPQALNCWVELRGGTCPLENRSHSRSKRAAKETSRMGSEELTFVVFLSLFSRRGLWTSGLGSDGQVRENRHMDLTERMRGTYQIFYVTMWSQILKKTRKIWVTEKWQDTGTWKRQRTGAERDVWSRTVSILSAPESHTVLSGQYLRQHFTNVSVRSEHLGTLYKRTFASVGMQWGLSYWISNKLQNAAGPRITHAIARFWS